MRLLQALTIDGGLPGLVDGLLCQARANGVFAISEISKGLAIVVVGDMVIADQVGELISAVALTVDALFSGS
jgi:hypothetical protein